jgi:hypothetical protein
MTMVAKQERKREAPERYHAARFNETLQSIHGDDQTRDEYPGIRPPAHAFGAV